MRYIKTRRRLLQALVFSGSLFTAFASHADRPAGRIVVIVAPGGSADALARMVANKAGERLQINFVVENKRSEEHTSELQSLMRISYAVFCLKKKKKLNINDTKPRNTICTLYYTTTTSKK